MNIKICDSHNDFLTELNVEEIPNYIEKVEREGAEIISSSYFSTHRENIWEDLQSRVEILRSCENKFLLHIEDLHFIKSEEDLDRLIKLKPFSCSLTWNYKNVLAGGALSQGGISARGNRCLEKLISNGIIIDLAHLNRKSFDEAIKMVPYKYCSHTAFYGKIRHKRNLTDKQVERIVSSNGYIGLYFYDRALTKNKEFLVDDVADSIFYFTARWGYDNLGIGSDFYGIDNYPKKLTTYKDFGFLRSALLERGLNQFQIENIFYKNFKKFISSIKS